MKKHAYGNTQTDDLWASLSHVSGKDVGQIMEIWTKNAGYPVVSVTEDPSRGIIKVEQHRFFQDGILADEDDKILYRKFKRARFLNNSYLI